jgi:uncharacterized protein (TIGR02265 family)
MVSADEPGDTPPLEFWLQDLARREAFMKPEHTMRGFFFNGMLENIRVLGDEELARRCQEASGEERFVDFFNYPFQRMSPILRTALPGLAERLGGAGALWEIGRRASQDFLASAAGRALLLLTQHRPRALLGSLSAAFRVSVSFSRMQLVWEGPTRGHLLLDQSFLPPPFHEGMLHCLLEASSARDIHVSARDTGPLLVTCDFRWA